MLNGLHNSLTVNKNKLFVSSGITSEYRIVVIAIHIAWPHVFLLENETRKEDGEKSRFLRLTVKLVADLLNGKRGNQKII